MYKKMWSALKENIIFMQNATKETNRLLPTHLIWQQALQQMHQLELESKEKQLKEKKNEKKEETSKD